MVQSGVLSPTQARNPHYFHHQIIKYARLLRQKGGVRKVRSPFQPGRKGSEEAYNTHYYQAEADWMGQGPCGYCDRANSLTWLKGSKYNVRTAYQRQARADNDANLLTALHGEAKKITPAEEAGALSSAPSRSVSC